MHKIIRTKENWISFIIPRDTPICAMRESSAAAVFPRWVKGMVKSSTSSSTQSCQIGFISDSEVIFETLVDAYVPVRICKNDMDYRIWHIDAIELYVNNMGKANLSFKVLSS